jgi:hypothetical protein
LIFTHEFVAHTKFTDQVVKAIPEIVEEIIKSDPEKLELTNHRLFI